MTITVLTAAGTVAAWDQGYPADVGRAVSANEWDWILAELIGAADVRFRWQGIGYSAGGFLMGNPDISYNESVAEGVAEGVRLVGESPGGIVLIGYSQGAEVAVRLAMEFLPGGDLSHRRKDLLRVITFGSPCRPAGRTAGGTNLPGDGISGVFTPPALRSITLDFVLEGDMYACSTKLLKAFYAILTDMELSIDFAGAVLKILLTAAGSVIDVPFFGDMLGGLLGPAKPLVDVIKEISPDATDENILTLQGLLKNIPDVLETLKVLMAFLQSGAHFSYHSWPAFEGKTGLQAAIDAVNAVHE